MYIHIDCNSYFASCEVATRPGLEGKPVVVASDPGNGGGIILALTAEAKALGLKRGIPLFKVRDRLEANRVEVCTADHKKYRRISRQIMDEVLRQDIVQDFVQYSVDEFFGTLPIEEPAEVRHYAQLVRSLIAERTGIPTGCGCSQSYTLAKVATHYAKRYAGYRGVCVLTPDKRERALGLLAVADVWGIGRKHRARLEAAGVQTALDFARLPRGRVEEMLGTAGLHTWLELGGTPAVRLENRDRKKSIMQSRTFPEMITDFGPLATAVHHFAAVCAESLRKQQSLCNNITVFINTNRFRNDLAQYANQASARLPHPTADTPLLMQAAEGLLRGIYRPGYRYKRAGVVLGGIVNDEGHQLDLFTVEADERRRRLMQVADSINGRFGDGSIIFGES